ncbi:MAG: alanine-tRNA synthetase second additional domain-containing protein [Planctomycetota bacterium]|jgi:hypothetical protein
MKNETLIYSAYYAPRGRERLYSLAGQLSQRYLYPSDFLIGIIGSEGSGKSTLIKGLFPGLELTNDDDGVNVPQAPLYSFDPEDFFAPHTFHIDIRYELAFRQQHELVAAINEAVVHGRRVVVEHFDLIVEPLQYNAQILFGVGEEVIVARPSVFGPMPAEIKAIVDRTIRYRLMAHTAEDLTGYFLEREYGYRMTVAHSDVKHGFVLSFKEKPTFSIVDLERKVLEVIAADVPVKRSGEDRIAMGDLEFGCTGVRTHIKRTSEIQFFRLCHEWKYNPITREYLLVGMVGKSEVAGFDSLMEPSGSHYFK